MPAKDFNIAGLTTAEVIDARSKYGENVLTYNEQSGLLKAIQGLAKEPMVILLLVTSGIYFISGNTGDGVFLASAILLVIKREDYYDEDEVVVDPYKLSKIEMIERFPATEARRD